uniref:Peptidase M3A/M3B catalytic domain-containing protein n=1 Tax=Eutreptiella gymnastica TaxID=73025 RepID=A0A7S4C954_9EUGL
MSYETVVLPLLKPPNYKTNPMVAEAKFYQHCGTDPQIRKVCQENGTRLSKARVQFRMRKDVYDVLDKYAATPEAAALPETEKWFLDSLLADFKRSGLALDDAARTKLEELLAADSEACSEYSGNVANDATKVVYTRAELEGVPEDFLDSHKDDDGNIVVTLKGPDLLPVLKYCAISESRKKLMVARETAYGNNLELMDKGAKLRKQIAQILGYPTYADYIVERRMTGKVAVVTEFLSSLQAKLMEAGKRDLEALKEVKKAHMEARGEGYDGKLHAWDVSFYDQLLNTNKYGVDQNEIKEYFPLHKVVDGTLEIYQELLGLVFTEATAFEKWHDDVRLFSVRDGASGELIGHFYLDLHPRDGKYTHAAIFHLSKRTPEQVPVDCMLCNMNPPTAESPALLQHAEVETFFHEFGHIMHSLCAEGDYNMTHLAKCPRDFVEAPSQMLENWCWQPEILARLSSHYKTKQPLPQDLLDKLIAAKNVNVALFTLRQVYLATLDMQIHTEPPEDLQALVDKLRPEISLLENPPGMNMLRAFGHLMNQYAAAYHGYLWSEVLSADMFHTRFEKEGVMNTKTGMDYRKMVLAPGGVGSIMDHLTTFLGRPPQQEAFLRSRQII